MTPTATQVAVLGAGPGGYAAAFLAADLGLTVTLVDAEENPGGVCLYRGCIPSKALLHVAKVLDEARHASAWGVTYQEPAIDLARLRGWKDQVVHELTSGLGQISRQRKIRFLQGTAALDGPNTLRVGTPGGEETVSFEHAILATGSHPSTIPGVPPGSGRLMDSTSALDLQEVPETLLVVGGGYIGLELGTVYAALGARVSVVEMTGGLLPGVDRDLVSVLARRIEKVCHRVMLNTRVTAITEEEAGLRVTFEGAGQDRSDEVFERVLIAVGRRPNSAIPGLEHTRVVHDERGFIEVDRQRRTAEPSLFAIGDLTGEPMLAHKASHEGRVAAETIAGHKAEFTPMAIPAVVFTDPEIAWCGLTELQAGADGRDVEIAKFPWGASGRAATIDRTDGVTKLVLEPRTGRILGVGLAGSGAG